MNKKLSYKFDKIEVYQGADIEFVFAINIAVSSISNIKITAVIKSEILGSIESKSINYDQATSQHSCIIPATFTEGKVGDMLLYVEVKYMHEGNQRTYRNRLNPFIIERFHYV